MTEEINEFDSPDFDAAIEAAKEVNLNRGNEEIIDDKPIVETPIIPPPADKPLDTPAAPNYAEYLDKFSEGLIKDEDSFKTALDKVKGYDSQEVKIKELEAKIPQFKNEETKALYDLWTAGDKDAVVNYIQETRKDYQTMSDLDVRREALKKDHPNWSAKDVDLEIRHKYGSSLEKIDLTDLDKDDPEYAEAVEHNKQVEKNTELLAVHARDDRYKLIDEQSKIELPKIKQPEAVQAPAQLSEQDIADATTKWVKSVEENLPKLSDIKQTIDGKEVVYSLNDDDKKALTENIKNFNIFKFAKARGWQNEDGSSNPIKIAEDVLKLDNFEKITKSFATQVKTTATKEVLGKIKNIDGSYTPTQDQAFEDLGDAFYNAKSKAKSA